MKPTYDKVAAAAAVLQQFARDTKGTASPSRTEAAVWSVWSALTGDGEPEHVFKEQVREARQAALERELVEDHAKDYKGGARTPPNNANKAELVDWANGILAEYKLPSIDESFGTKAEIIEHVQAVS